MLWIAHLCKGEQTLVPMGDTLWYMRWVISTLVFVLLAAGGQDLLSRGQQAFLAGNYPLAEELFREHVQTHPDDARGLSNLAAVLARRESYPEAVTLYRKALSAAPALVEIRFNLAVALLKSGHPADAIAELRAFAKARPQDLRARQLLGISLLEAGDYAGAITELEPLVTPQSGDPSVLFALATAHVRRGDESRGRELLARLDRYPAQARLLEGLLEYRAGRFAEASAKFEACLKVDPNQPSALAALGRLHLLKREDEEAISLLERALAMAPQDAESAYQLGVLYDRNGQPEKGRDSLRRAIALRENYADPYYQLARIAHRDGQFAEALTFINDANRLLPNHEAILFLRGRILQSLGRSNQARSDFEAVRRIKAKTIESSRQRMEGEISLQP